VILAGKTEDELLDYRSEMMAEAQPYLDRIKAIDVALARIAAEKQRVAGGIFQSKKE
jgi:hypothetical protein